MFVSTTYADVRQQNYASANFCIALHRNKTQLFIVGSWTMSSYEWNRTWRNT